PRAAATASAAANARIGQLLHATPSIAREPTAWCDTVSTLCHTPCRSPVILARMATVTGRQAEMRRARAESRERIVTAATELLRRRGYAELTVDEVMREAGLARTIFYRHFGDLGELLRRVSRQAIDDLPDAQRELER